MKKILATLLVLSPISCDATPKPKPQHHHYSSHVERITAEQTEVPKVAIYVGPSVVRPGAYAFTKGMTIADAVKMAGGLKLPSIHLQKAVRFAPMTISLYRPTKADPDPKRPIFTCPFEIKSPPDYGLTKCGQQFEPGDLLLVQDLTRFIIP